MCQEYIVIMIAIAVMVVRVMKVMKAMKVMFCDGYKSHTDAQRMHFYVF
jgi:hypothetical protein